MESRPCCRYECQIFSRCDQGSDIFLGLSVKDALTKEMLKSMNENPIIFAMANPDPEIDPKLQRKLDLIVLLPLEDLITLIK